MRRRCLLASFALLAGCHREPPPLTDAALSLLAPASDGGCNWRRLDPATTRSDAIAHVDVPCDGLTIGWDAQGARAIVGADSALWLWSPTAFVRLPPPKLPEIWSDDPVRAPTRVTSRLRSLGFALDGSPKIETDVSADVIVDGTPRCTRVPVVEQHLVDGAWIVRSAGDPTIMSCGPTLGPTLDGSLAIGAFPRLRPFDGGKEIRDDATLYRLETAFPRETPTPVAEPASSTRIVVHTSPARSPAEEARNVGAILDRLSGGPSLGAISPFSPADIERAKSLRWEENRRRDRATRALTAAWTGVSFEGGMTLALRFETWAFVTPAGAIPPPEAPQPISECWVRDPYLLLTSHGGTQPRLYDKSGALRWKSDDARRVTFWPKPTLAESVARR